MVGSHLWSQGITHRHLCVQTTVVCSIRPALLPRHAAAAAPGAEWRLPPPGVQMPQCVSLSRTAAGDTCRVGFRHPNSPFNSHFTQRLLLLWINEYQDIFFLLLVSCKLYHTDIGRINHVFHLQIFTRGRNQWDNGSSKGH